MKDPIALSEDSDSDDEQTYCVGNMVTVWHKKSNAATLFWVGAITSVKEGFTNKIEVCWFEIVLEAKIKSSQTESEESGCFEGNTCYTAKYRKCFVRNMESFSNEISAKCVLVLFESLTS